MSESAVRGYIPARLEPNMPPATQPAVMTIKQFCVWSALGRTKVYEEISASRLRTLKVGRRRLIRWEEANRWLASHEAFSPAPQDQTMRQN